MAYASASDVSSLTPHLLSGSTASTFTANTSPTLTQVNAWLSSGCAAINARLASAGYGAISTTSAAYEFALQANALYAAYLAERSLLSARVSDDENTRAQMFKRDFDDTVKLLASLDLSRLGVSRTKAPPAHYAGGISADDKDVNEDDTDIVQPRFGRGMFTNREALAPLASAS